MQAVIIAAGESSRFWPLNHHHKSQNRLFGKPLVYWTIKGFLARGVREFVVVCRPGSGMRELLEQENDLGVRIMCVEQTEGLGTGNALSYAKPFIKEPFFVSWPNKINSYDIVGLVEEQKKQGARVVLVGGRTKTPWDYGVVRFEGGDAKEIVENPAPGTEPSDIKAVGFYALEPDFFEHYDRLSSHHEADLIDAINSCLKEHKGLLALLEQDVPALKYPWEMFLMAEILFRSASFVPGIAPSARIGNYTVVDEQSVHIGENTVIRDGTIIEGPAYIGNNCEVGYHNVIRQGVVMEDGVKTGAGFEIKHSIVGRETHFHSGYVGDSIIGEHCRFGAGFITANRRIDRENIHAMVKGKEYDTGLTRFGIVAGDNVRTGIRVGTMPGVFLGVGSLVGPGMQVFHNIADGEKLFARS